MNSAEIAPYASESSSSGNVPHAGNEVVLILPFYGSLPWYFNYFLKSLEGKSIDVLFVSDLVPEKHPANFHLLKLDFASMNRLLNAKLGTDISLSNTYKLCDFKPMYGKIFEDYIKGYRYWAFGDCDLVYGNALNPLLGNLVAGEWDVVSFRERWVSGSFCMMRNTERVNILYSAVKTLPKMLATPQYDYFDEIGGIWFPELEGGAISMADCEKRRDSFSALVWRTPGIRFLHKDMVCEDSVCGSPVEMRGGELTLEGKNIPIFHYINAKHIGRFTGKSVPYDVIRDYRVNYQGHFRTAIEWRMRSAIGAWRNIVLHWRTYRDMARRRGSGALLAHLARRLCGSGGRA